MIGLERVATLAALGPANLIRVAAYRVGLRLGLHPVLKLKSGRPAPPFYRPPMASTTIYTEARSTWLDSTLYFGAHKLPAEEPPDWHANPLRPGARANANLHWSKIPDFDPVAGDIKTVWEASRFDWLIAMAQRAAKSDSSEIARLNAWLESWVTSNPPYLGANWKCGQEASIRVMHMALAALLLDQVEQPCPSLIELVRLHLARVAPTLAYAIGQQNNHGTSEAAALFIGGSWLDRLGEAEGPRWMRVGLHWLEELARELIEPDGTFSQYSANYHRVMLDTYSMAEVWRRRLGLAAFSTEMKSQLANATEWMRQLTNAESGEVPNIGANDGAHLISLTDSGHRDYRPTVQLAAALFMEGRAYVARGPWDQALHWMNVGVPARALPPPQSASLDAGGLHILRRGPAVAFLRYPRFRFRPSQADALHLDLWIEGENVLRDAGSYSYNASEADTAYFNGTAAHCTVQFDGRDQMPRLGRFLFGHWLKARGVLQVTSSADSLTAAAGYRDRWGAAHHRQIWLSNERLVCRDELSGHATIAVLRWRLSPGSWNVSGTTVSSPRIRLTVESDTPEFRFEMTEGAESRYYHQKTPVPVLEVEVSVPAVLTTEIRF